MPVHADGSRAQRAGRSTVPAPPGRRACPDTCAPIEAHGSWRPGMKADETAVVRMATSEESREEPPVGKRVRRRSRRAARDRGRGRHRVPLRAEDPARRLSRCRRVLRRVGLPHLASRAARDHGVRARCRAATSGPGGRGGCSPRSRRSPSSCLIVAAINLSDTEMHDLRAQALGTLFYCVNWVIIHQNGNYFATLGRPSPFLHMWTLAVEEQFYIVLPLVFFAAAPGDRAPPRAHLADRPGRRGCVDGVDGSALLADGRPDAARTSGAIPTRWDCSWAWRSACSRAWAGPGRPSPRACAESRRPRPAPVLAAVALIVDPRDDARRRRNHSPGCSGAGSSCSRRCAA